MLGPGGGEYPEKGKRVLLAADQTSLSAWARMIGKADCLEDLQSYLLKTHLDTRSISREQFQTRVGEGGSKGSQLISAVSCLARVHRPKGDSSAVISEILELTRQRERELSSGEGNAVTKRKAAQQERSKAKVRLILDTTLAMLNEGPADQVTTNEIARKAGISIGSLYQFFPRKEAIFYELFSEWLQQTLDLLDEVGERFDGSERLEELSDAVFECLSRDDAINSLGHWQLLRAMGSTEELVELEHQHQQEVFQRIIAFQRKFGRKIPDAQAEVLAGLQHRVTIGVLTAAATAGSCSERNSVLEWGRKTLGFVYDIDRLNG